MRGLKAAGGTMMQAVQGWQWTNERDSNSGGPTDELRRKWRGRGAPTGQGVIGSSVQWYSSSVQDGNKVDSLGFLAFSFA